MKNRARGGSDLTHNAVDTRVSSSSMHLINREPGYEAKFLSDNYSGY